MNGQIVKKTLRRKLAELDAQSVACADCVRLFAGRADGRDGLLIDRFGSLWVAIDYAPAKDARADPVACARELTDLLRELGGDTHLITKIRSQDEDGDSFSCAYATPTQATAM